MEKVFIDLAKESYSIYIGQGLVKTIDRYIEDTDKIMIITDENVDKLYSKAVKNALKERSVYKFIVTPGEESKNLLTVENILSQMLDLNFTRKSKIIALGGGVVGDIGGFCASIYMRGISFLQVPTSLLAQVDSSVGGKTGVNLAKGKNMIGSFYQPENVIIDTDTLKTLPKKEIISGLGEIIKYGIIWDYKFLEEIEENIHNILELEYKTLGKIIKDCCSIKADIVSQDEKELGLRKILNFGHTIGHALETASAYKKYTHGQAILLGMYYEALMAKGFNMIDIDYFNKIEKIIKETGINLDIEEFSKEALLDNMTKDKKNKDGKISFILPIGPGRVEEVLLNRGEIRW